MRKTLPKKLEDGRERTGPFASDPQDGANGKFYIQGPCGAILMIVASDGQDPEAEGWEHVSVSIPNRCPNWTEMCFVKDLFWDEEECVVQFHPPKSEYVNNHPYCLHLWRDLTADVRLPPSHLVGLKDRDTMTNRERMEAWIGRLMGETT